MGSHTVAKLKLPFFAEAEACEFLGADVAAVPEHSGQSPRLMRGIRFALMIEVVAGLCAYGIWKLL